MAGERKGMFDRCQVRKGPQNGSDHLFTPPINYVRRHFEITKIILILVHNDSYIRCNDRIGLCEFLPFNNCVQKSH